MAQRLKRLPAMRETRVRSLGWEDPLEKEMATHSSTLAWKIPWPEEPDRLQSMGSQRIRHDWETSHCSMSSSNCCFLTCICVSQEAGKLVWYSHLFKNFPQFVVIYTVKDFSVVSEAEVDVFLEFFGFFYDPTAVGNLISSSSAFSKSSLNIWEFLVHVLLKPHLENFKHVRWVQLCSNLNFLWRCFSLGLAWKLTFSSPVATAEFPRLLAY